jgi:hypothetical protein
MDWSAPDDLIGRIGWFGLNKNGDIYVLKIFFEYTWIKKFIKQKVG